MDNKVLLHRERIAWQGKHSGYDQLCNYLHRLSPGKFLDIFVDRSRMSHKRVVDVLFSPIYYMWKKITSGYDIALSKADLEVFWKNLRYQYHLIHVMYVERNFGYIDKWKPRVTKRIVGTVHQPPYWWNLHHQDPGMLSDLDAIIVVSRELVVFFEPYLQGRVHFIPLGIDIDFFKPGIEKNIIWKTNTRFACLLVHG